MLTLGLVKKSLGDMTERKQNRHTVYRDPVGRETCAGRLGLRPNYCVLVWVGGAIGNPKRKSIL